MTPRLFVLLFVAGLLVLGILAIACGDDGGGNDEDAIRDTFQAVTDACNAGDSERVAELETSAGPGCLPHGLHEFLSVRVEGDPSRQHDSDRYAVGNSNSPTGWYSNPTTVNKPKGLVAEQHASHSAAGQRPIGKERTQSRSN